MKERSGQNMTSVYNSTTKIKKMNANIYYKLRDKIE